MLGFKENQIFETKEYSIIKRIKKVFIKQKIIDQIKINKYFIDLYSPEHKLGIEIDENCHLDRLKIILILKLVKYKILFMNLY